MWWNNQNSPYPSYDPRNSQPTNKPAPMEPKYQPQMPVYTMPSLFNTISSRPKPKPAQKNRIAILFIGRSCKDFLEGLWPNMDQYFIFKHTYEQSIFYRKYYVSSEHKGPLFSDKCMFFNYGLHNRNPIETTDTYPCGIHNRVPQDGHIPAPFVMGFFPYDGLLPKDAFHGKVWAALAPFTTKGHTCEAELVFIVDPFKTINSQEQMFRNCTLIQDERGFNELRLRHLSPKWEEFVKTFLVSSPPVHRLRNWIVLPPYAIPELIDVLKALSQTVHYGGDAVFNGVTTYLLRFEGFEYAFPLCYTVTHDRLFADYLKDMVRTDTQENIVWVVPDGFGPDPEKRIHTDHIVRTFSEFCASLLFPEALRNLFTNAFNVPVDINYAQPEIVDLEDQEIAQIPTNANTKVITLEDLARGQLTPEPPQDPEPTSAEQRPTSAEHFSPEQPSAELTAVSEEHKDASGESQSSAEPLPGEPQKISAEVSNTCSQNTSAEAASGEPQASAESFSGGIQASAEPKAVTEEPKAASGEPPASEASREPVVIPIGSSVESRPLPVWKGAQKYEDLKKVMEDNNDPFERESKGIIDNKQNKKGRGKRSKPDPVPVVPTESRYSLRPRKAPKHK